MGSQAKDLVDQIRQRLHEVLGRITLARVFYGLLLFLGVGLALWTIFTWLEAGLWLDGSYRAGLLGIVLSSLLVILSWFVIRPLGKKLGWWAPLDEYDAAERVGAHYPHIQDRITNLLELADSSKSTNPNPFVDRAVMNLGNEVKDSDFSAVENFSAAKGLARMAAIPLVVFVLSSILAPGPFLGASSRLLQPMQEFFEPASYSLKASPGNATVLYGEAFKVGFQADGLEIPSNGVLAYQYADEDIVQELRLDTDSASNFLYEFSQVRRPFEYSFQLGDVATENFKVKIVRRPSIRNMQVEVDFPSYTQIPRRRLDPNLGDFMAMPGSRASFKIDIGPEPIERAYLIFSDSTKLDLEQSGSQLTGVLTVRKPDSYKIVLEGSDGVSNADPIDYAIKVRYDEFPSVVILAPDSDSDLPDNMSTVLRARIIDDFGFRNLNLNYRLAEAAYSEAMVEFKSVPVSISTSGQLDQEILHLWEVQKVLEMEMLPGDVVEYYLEIEDNDRYSSYKSARSGIQVVRVPSLSEQFEELEEAEDEVQDGLEEMLKQAEEMKDEFSELRDELRRKQESDWDDERQLEKLKDQQDSMQQQLEEISEQMDDMIEQMSENETVSNQTQETFEELQKVMEEINSPEMMEALEKLQEAMKNMDLQQMQQSIENFEFNEEQYRKRMERTLEMLKRFRTEQSLEEAAERAEELAEMEEKINEATQELMKENEEGSQEGEQESEQGSEENESQQSEQNQEGNNNEQKDGQQKADDLAKEQLQAKDEMEKLEKLMEEIQEQMEDMENAPSEEMQEMNENIQSQDMPSQMQQNSEQLEKGDMKKAEQGQKQMQQALQQMSSSLSQMGEQMSMEQMQINIAALRRVLDDVLSLSKGQENLRKDLSTIRAENPAVRELAKKQVDLQDGLELVADTLQKLSADIPQMSSLVQTTTGEALRDIKGSISEMSERRITQATGYQKSSMKNLNDLALMLSDLMGQLMDQMSNSGMNQNPGMSGQQFSQMLSEMASKQAQLNQQMDAMLNDMMGNRMSQSAKSRMKQLQQQQQQLMEQLQDAMQNGGKENMDKVLGDLNKVAEQMKESVKDLQQNQVTRETKERQHEILSRLLQAQQSLRERGKENKREGKSADDYAKDTPSELPPNERADKLRRDLLRALENGYSSDYEEIIKRYFEALQNESKN